MFAELAKRNYGDGANDTWQKQPEDLYESKNVKSTEVQD